MVEGFAAGKSLICARSGGIPELATLGQTVALYDPTNDRGLIDCLRSAMADPDTWKRGSIQNIKISEAFSAETVVTAHIDAYMKVARASDPNPEQMIDLIADKAEREEAIWLDIPDGSFRQKGLLYLAEHKLKRWQSHSAVWHSVQYRRRLTEGADQVRQAIRSNLNA